MHGFAKTCRAIVERSDEPAFSHSKQKQAHRPDEAEARDDRDFSPIAYRIETAIVPTKTRHPSLPL
jgi:hypothetical protein